MGVPVDQSHNHFIGNIIQPPNTALSLSGIQTVRKVGPFHVAYNTPDIYGGSPAVGLVELTPGTVVIRVWAFFGEAFNGLNDLLVFNIGAANFDDLSGFATIPASGASASEEVASLPLANVVATPQIEKVGIATEDRPWLVVYIAADNPPVAGEADIYALIAEPT